MKFNPKPHRRRGTTVADLLVAATLLAVMMTTVMTMTVRTGRLRQQTRQQQLALDELSNQLERLISLDADDRKRELASLALSEHLVSLLPGATLTGQSVDDELGTRIELNLRWDQAIQSKPLSLVGWVDVGSSLGTQP
jgi:hypothetical protein